MKRKLDHKETHVDCNVIFLFDIKVCKSYNLSVANRLQLNPDNKEKFMNYYKEYENLEIPTYKMPKKKNTSVCQWSSTRPTKVTATPKKNLVVETTQKLASEQVATTLAPNQNEIIHTIEENKINL